MEIQTADVNLSTGEFVDLDGNTLPDMWSPEEIRKRLIHRLSGRDGIDSCGQDAEYLGILVDGAVIGLVAQIAPGADPDTWMFRRYMYRHSMNAGHTVIFEEHVPKSRVKLIFRPRDAKPDQLVDLFTGEPFEYPDSSYDTRLLFRQDLGILTHPEEYEKRKAENERKTEEHNRKFAERLSKIVTS